MYSSSGVGVASVNGGVWRRRSREAEALSRASRANESLAALMQAIQTKTESERAQSSNAADVSRTFPNDRLSRVQTPTPPPSQALRSELKFLHDGLLQLKQAIATRKQKCSRPLFMQKQSQSHSRTPSPSNLDLNQQESPLEDGACSQTDSAAPSVAIQNQIMTSITALANRLRRLEESGPKVTPPPAAENLTVLQAASTAALQAELTQERLTRMQLAAVLTAAWGRENSSHLNQLPYLPELEALNDAQLRLVIRQMSLKLEELTKSQVSAKTKSVELAAALKSIKDLSANIVELEERIRTGQTDGGVELVEKMSVRLRAQMSRLRAMSRELEIFRRVLSDGCLEIVGGDEEAKRLAQELLSDKLASPSPSSSMSPSPSRKKKPPAPAFDDATTPLTEEAESPRQQIHKAVNQINEHEIDAAVSQLTNSRISRIKLTKVGPGQFLFGRLNVRITLSANSKTPLAFCNGKKYSLKKFINTHEAQESATLGYPISQCNMEMTRPPSVPMTTMQTPSRPMKYSTLQTPEKLPQARDGPRGLAETGESPSKQLEVFRWLHNGSKQIAEPRLPIAARLSPTIGMYPTYKHRPQLFASASLLSTSPPPASSNSPLYHQSRSSAHTRLK